MRVLHALGISVLAVLASCGPEFADHSGRIDSLASSVPGPGRSVESDSLKIDRSLIGPELLLYGTVVRVDADPAGLGRGWMKGFQSPVSQVVLETTGNGGDSELRAHCLENCPDDAPLFRASVRSSDANDVALERDAIVSAFGLTQLSSWFEDKTVVLDHRISVFTDDERTGLIFDVETRVEMPWYDDEFWVTARWFLGRADDHRDPRVERIVSIPEIGELLPGGYDTDAVRPAIRHPLAEPVHFLVKALPSRHHRALEEAIASWNAIGEARLGQPLLSYEHIPRSHPDYDEFVAGDPRYNIIEWDALNVAGYAGVAFSAALLETGQVLRSGILLQGPNVERYNREWFGIDGPSNNTNASSSSQSLRRSLPDPVDPSKPSIGVRAGRFRFTPPDCDRVTRFFELRDPELDYDNYMYGYIKNLIIHEIGHALGLGHNFMGSIVEDENRVSNSVMEYVHRNVRHRRTVGSYDADAIAYLYAEQIPETPEPFCSRPPSVENPNLSAECSLSDGGIDPFSFLDAKLKLTLDRTLGLSQPDGIPIWPVDRIYTPFFSAAEAMLFYATSANETSDQWLKFHDVPGRPNTPDAITDYVVDEVFDTVCQSSYATHAELVYESAPEVASDFVKDWDTLVYSLMDTCTELGLPSRPCDALEAVRWMTWE